MPNTMCWITPLRKERKPSLERKPRSTLSSVFEIRIKVVCATEASVSSAPFLLLEGICFVFHWDYCKIAFSYKFTVTFFSENERHKWQLTSKQTVPGPGQGCVCYSDGWLPLSRIELVELRLMKIKPIIHIAGSVTKQETKQIGWIKLKWNFQAIFCWGG